MNLRFLFQRNEYEGILGGFPHTKTTEIEAIFGARDFQATKSPTKMGMVSLGGELVVTLPETNSKST